MIHFTRLIATFAIALLLGAPLSAQTATERINASRIVIAHFDNRRMKRHLDMRLLNFGFFFAMWKISFAW